MTPTTYEDVVSAIDAGHVDDNLLLIKKQIETRLQTLRKTRTIDDYKIGSNVVFNDFCGTAYLRGHTAVVTGRARTKLTVMLDNPVGRFATYENGAVKSVTIKVPPSIVDLVS